MFPLLKETLPSFKGYNRIQIMYPHVTLLVKQFCAEVKFQLFDNIFID